jgi:hypothetical protein
MISSFIRTLRAKPIEDPSELRRFLSGESSYLAQRMTYEFSRNTLAWFGQHYFADPGFNNVFAKCRWESFGLLGADIALLAFGRMAAARPDGHAALADRMQDLYAAILHEYPVPDHRFEGWADMEAAFRTRMADVRLPVDPIALAEATAKAIFKTLPVFSENKTGDYMVIYNAVSFGLVAFSDRLRKRVAADRVGAAILAGEPLDRDRMVPVA